MASRKSRTRQTKRDRRKAKASNWTREGRTNPKKVAHASGGGRESTTIKAKVTRQRPARLSRPVITESEGFNPFADLLSGHEKAPAE